MTPHVCVTCVDIARPSTAARASLTTSIPRETRFFYARCRSENARRVLSSPDVPIRMRHSIALVEEAYPERRRDVVTCWKEINGQWPHSSNPRVGSRKSDSGPRRVTASSHASSQRRTQGRLRNQQQRSRRSRHKSVAVLP